MNLNIFIIKPKAVLMIAVLLVCGAIMKGCYKVEQQVQHEEAFHATVIANQVLIGNTGGKSDTPYTIPTLALKLDDGVVFDYTTSLAACANFPVGSRVVVNKKVHDLYPDKALDNKHGLYCVGTVFSTVAVVIAFLFLIGA